MDKEKEIQQENTTNQPQNPVQEFYERFRDVPLWRIDLFIGICVALLVLIVVFGSLKGHGII